jgi:hypothetical protein
VLPGWSCYLCFNLSLLRTNFGNIFCPQKEECDVGCCSSFCWASTPGAPIVFPIDSWFQSTEVAADIVYFSLVTKYNENAKKRMCVFSLTILFRMWHSAILHFTLICAWNIRSGRKKQEENKSCQRNQQLKKNDVLFW